MAELQDDEAFEGLPAGLRRELLDAFAAVVKNFAEHRWEPSEMNGGKLCEVAYSILKGYLAGRYPASASKPRNMVQACQALEQVPASDAPRSVRIQIPRMILALYEIRNNRNVGHVGGDVDPNQMDATAVLQMSKWILAELLRLLHALPVDEAAALADALVERDVPLVWSVGEKKRLLAPGLKYQDQMLVLLHATPGAVKEADLMDWIEPRNRPAFRRDVIKPAHRARLVEYDDAAKTVEISPRGIEVVEDGILHELRASAA